MPAYLVGSAKVLDMAKVEAYAAASGPIVEKYGGKTLAASPTVRHLEGPMPEGSLIIMEFPNRKQAEAFWDDPDYQEAAKLREGGLEVQLDIIEGT